MAWCGGIHSQYRLAVLVDVAPGANSTRTLGKQITTFERLRPCNVVRSNLVTSGSTGILMTHRKVTIVIAILSLLVFSSIVFAQETTANTKTADETRRKKAVELLESLASQITSLQSPENRARIGANIAESLWKDEENRARALFIGIEDDIKLGFQDRNISDPAD